MITAIIPKNNFLQIIDRNYKHLNECSFNKDVNLAFSNTDIQACAELKKNFINLLDHHAPFKKKLLRPNNAPNITKRSQLEKIHMKTLTEKSLKAYKKQSNYVSRLSKKERKIFFNS